MQCWAWANPSDAGAWIDRKRITSADRPSECRRAAGEECGRGCLGLRALWLSALAGCELLPLRRWNEAPHTPLPELRTPAANDRSQRFPGETPMNEQPAQQSVSSSPASDSRRTEPGQRVVMRPCRDCGESFNAGAGSGRFFGRCERCRSRRIRPGERTIMRPCRACGEPFNAGAGTRRLFVTCERCRAPKPKAPTSPGPKPDERRRLAPGDRPAVLRPCRLCGREFDSAGGTARLRQFCETCRSDPNRRRDTMVRHGKRNALITALGRTTVNGMRRQAIEAGARDVPPVPYASATKQQRALRASLFYSLGKSKFCRLPSVEATGQ